MVSGRETANVSEDRLAADLRGIHEEVRAPIVVLFDEANVLVSHRSILQKIRNLFMNLSGYMMVIVGTNDLFPVMNDIFSSISRDFKRMSVGSFQTIEEARDCVLNPLRSIGIELPESLYAGDVARFSKPERPDGCKPISNSAGLSLSVQEHADKRL
jgi:hypothetical protein